MKIAILMSSYNGERYIRQQIDSILNQRGAFELELWVRDDGSTDSTRDILEDYAAQGLLRWYTGDNLKPAHSFLDLLKHCSGYDFYAFADQDDVWKPEKIAAGLAALKEVTGPALYFANAELVDQDLNSLGRNVYRKSPALDFYTLSCAGGLLGCTMVFNRQLAQLVQDAPMPGRIVMHDYYLAVVCKLFDGTIIYDPTAYMGYRQHGKNVVGVSRSKTAALRNRIRSVTKKAAVTIAEQTQSVLDAYPVLPDHGQYRWLKQLAAMSSSLPARFSVACACKTRYISLEKSLTLRLAILLGNR